MRFRPTLFATASAVAALVGVFGPFGEGDTTSLAAVGLPALVLALAALVFSLVGNVWTVTLVVPLGLLGSFLAVRSLEPLIASGAWGYWTFFWGSLLAAVFAAGRVSLVEGEPGEASFVKRLRQAVPPATVPFVLLLIWQGLVVGYRVPKGIFPSVSNVYQQLAASLPVLLNDSYVTFIKEVAFGFTLGLAAGFLVGVAIAFSPFLQQGFLPLAAAFGAVPIVGLAPVLGRAFGVDWESKAAVVVIVTFFPVVLNTVQGLTLVDPLKLELLKAYAAKPRDIFFKLRLPNALPYLFNAIKLAAVLSVISVIVAEFLIPGPPIGLGQRISLSARRGAYDVVFAAIFVSSFFSILIYGLLSALERLLTGWHPSFREERG